MPGSTASADARARPGMATHYMRYSMSSVVLMLAGLVSFPLLTRLLDNTQYGIFRYYEAIMLAAVVVLKLGAQHSISRFYPYGGDAARHRAFGTNLVLLPLLLAVVLWATAMSAGVLWAWWAGWAIDPVVWCVAFMTPMVAAITVLQMVARARERSDVVVATRVLGKLLELAIVIAAVVLVQRSALAVFGGKLLATVALLAWLVHWMRANLPMVRAAIDPGQFRAAMAFGLPLMAHELAYQVMGTLDRVLLREITGDFAAVGIYTIGYSLAILVNVFVSAILWESVTPVITRTYESEGSGAVREIKARILVPMTYVVVAIVAMLLVCGEDLLVALSGPGKAASGEVFVVVGIVLSLFALFSVSNYGMLLAKRSVALLMMSLGGAALNVALNLAMVPRMGYMGSAWATAITYAALTVAWFAACPRDLVQWPALRTVVVSTGCAAVLVGVALGTDLFGVSGAWPRLVVSGCLLAVLYIGPVLAIDPRAWAMVRALRKAPRPDHVPDREHPAP